MIYAEGQEFYVQDFQGSFRGLKLELLRISSEGKLDGQSLEKIIGILSAGGTGVIPTDTVYGICACALNEDGVKKVLEIKKRPPDKPFPIQVASLAQANEIGDLESHTARILANSFWPGALTLVVKIRKGVKLPFQGKTVGLRVPNSPLCLQIIGRVGPIILPSANVSGEKAPSRFHEISPEILEVIDFAVDGGACKHGIESTVVSLANGFKIEREGALSIAEIKKVLASAKG